jgi:hypothetical protein
VRCYCEHVGGTHWEFEEHVREPIESLGNMWRTKMEHSALLTNKQIMKKGIRPKKIMLKFLKLATISSLC